MSKLLTALDRPIAFHRALVDVAGSVAGAVMLSQAIYWQRRAASDDGWWWKTAAEWTEETGLSAKEQATIRKRLIEVGVWQEQRRGIPAKLWFCIDVEALENKISPSGRSGYAPRADLDTPEEQITNKESETKETETTTEIKEGVALRAIPPELATPEFSWAWSDWIADRKQRRKAMTTRAQELALAKMAKWGPERAIAAIEASIANGWTGIFEEKHSGVANSRGMATGGGRDFEAEKKQREADRFAEELRKCAIIEAEYERRNQ